MGNFYHRCEWQLFFVLKDSGLKVNNAKFDLTVPDSEVAAYKQFIEKIMMFFCRNELDTGLGNSIQDWNGPDVGPFLMLCFDMEKCEYLHMVP